MSVRGADAGCGLRLCVVLRRAALLADTSGGGSPPRTRRCRLTRRPPESLLPPVAAAEHSRSRGCALESCCAAVLAADASAEARIVRVHHLRLAGTRVHSLRTPSSLRHRLHRLSLSSCACSRSAVQASHWLATAGRWLALCVPPPLRCLLGASEAPTTVRRRHHVSLRVSRLPRASCADSAACASCSQVPSYIDNIVSSRPHLSELWTPVRRL